MQSIFTFAQAHQVLVWALFLAPVFVVMCRGMILDNRALRYGVPSRYHLMLVLGFVPVLNIAVAVLCLVRSVHEYRTKHVSLLTNW